MGTKRVLFPGAALLLLLMAFPAFCGGQKEGAKAGGMVTIIMERPLWQTPDPSAPNKTKVREAIKKAIGIDVQLAGQPDPADQYEKPNLMLAAGEPLDIFQVPTSVSRGWRKYMADGLIAPLNELLDKYGPNLKQKLDPQGLKDCTDKDGTIWAIADEQPPVPTYIMARKDWMDKQGIVMPAAPTVADYEKMLEAFKKEGSEGIVGMWGYSVDWWIAGAYIPTATANFVDTDGKLKPYYLHPGYRQILAKLRDWYAKGYLHREYFTLSYQQAVDIAWTRGKSGCFLTWKGVNPQLDEETLRKTVPEGRLVPLPAPKGDYGPLVIRGATPTADLMITKSSKHPDVAMKFLDWGAATDEGWMLCQYGIENEDWMWVDKAKGVFKKKTDVPANIAYGHGSFASARLLYNYLKFHPSEQGKEWAAWVNDTKRFPSAYAVDFGVVYDRNTFKSKDQLTALDTMRNETVAKIVMGQLPLAEADAMLERWYRTGGTDYINDITAAFKAQKK